MMETKKYASFKLSRHACHASTLLNYCNLISFDIPCLGALHQKAQSSCTGAKPSGIPKAAVKKIDATSPLDKLTSFANSSLFWFAC